MSISTFSNAQLLEELISRGVLTAGQGSSAIKRADRASERAQAAAHRQGVLELVSNFLNSDEGKAQNFWSIKPTSGSVASSQGIIQHVDASREDILWSLKKLEKEGKARQVGVIKKSNDEGESWVELVEPGQVNNFQRRWVLAS
jgi:hypothetical protein